MMVKVDICDLYQIQNALKIGNTATAIELVAYLIEDAIPCEQ